MLPAVLFESQRKVGCPEEVPRHPVVEEWLGLKPGRLFVVIFSISHLLMIFDMLYFIF